MIVAAVEWIARSAYPEVRSPHLNRLSKDGIDNLDYLLVAPERPAGLRDILNPAHPVAAAMRDRLNDLGIKTDMDKVPIPKCRDEIRTFLIARFPFLFDHAHYDPKVLPYRQTTRINDAYHHVAGWDLDDVETIFLFAWDNKRRGGKGMASFNRLWCRDLKGFLTLYKETAGKPARPLRNTVAIDDICKRMTGGSKALDALRHIAEDLFELERGLDCLSGLKLLRIEAASAKLESRIRLNASVSPFLISIARTDPHLIRTGDFEQQADLAGRTTALFPIAKRDLISDKEKTEPHYVGWNDLNYIIHLFSKLRSRRSDNFTNHTGVSEHDSLRSKIFRLSLNFIAFQEPERAKNHLRKRLSEEGHKSALKHIKFQTSEGVSFFEGNATAHQSSLSQTLQSFHIGASYVAEFRKDAVEPAIRGLSSKEENPAIRAFFYPDGWTEDIFTEPLLNSWKESAPELSKLDKRYANEKRTTFLDTSAVMAGHLTECVIAPLTDRGFAVSLSILSPVNLAIGAAKKTRAAQKCKKNSPEMMSNAEKAQKSALSPANDKTRIISKLLLKPS